MEIQSVYMRHKTTGLPLALALQRFGPSRVILQLLTCNTWAPHPSMTQRQSFGILAMSSGEIKARLAY